jgi:hypothetical protein
MHSPESANRQYHPYSISHDHTHGNHPNGCLRCATDEANATPSPTASAKLGNLGTHLNYSQGTTTVNSPQQTPPSPTLSHTSPNSSALTTTGLGTRNGTTSIRDIMEQLSNGGTRQFGLPNTGELGSGKVVPLQQKAITGIFAFVQRGGRRGYLFYFCLITI